MGSMMDDIYDAMNDAEQELGAVEDGVKDEPEATEATEITADDLDEDEPVDEEPEAEPEDELEASAEEEPEAGGPDWDRLDELPNEVLPPRVARLRQERDRLASETGEMRKRLAALEEQVKAAQPKPAEDEDPRPPSITSDDTAEEIEQKIEALTEWKTRQALKSVEAKFAAQEEKEQRAHQERAQAFFSEQEKRIMAKEGYTKDVEDEMISIVKNNPAWYNELGKPESWDELFDYAISKVERAKGFKKQNTKLATAKNRVVPRRSTAPKNVEPDIEMPDTDDVSAKVHAIMDGLMD